MHLATVFNRGRFDFACLQEYQFGPSEARVDPFTGGHLLVKGIATDNKKLPTILLHCRWKPFLISSESVNKHVAVDLLLGKQVIRIVSSHLPSDCTRAEFDAAPV